MKIMLKKILITILLLSFYFCKNNKNDASSNSRIIYPYDIILEAHAQKNYKKAFKLLDSVLKIDSLSIELRQKKAVILNETKQYEEALNELAIIFQINDYNLKDNEFTSYFTKYIPDSINFFKSNTFSSEQNIEKRTLYTKGVYYASKKKYDVAEKYFKKFLQKDSLHCNALITLSRVLLLQNKAQKAIETLENQNNECDSYYMYYYMAEASAMVKKYIEAKVYIDHALYINPEKASSYYLRGNLNFRDQKLKKAIKDYELAIHYNSDKADYYNALGVTKHKFYNSLNLYKLKKLDQVKSKAIKNNSRIISVYLKEDSPFDKTFGIFTINPIKDSLIWSEINSLSLNSSLDLETQIFDKYNPVPDYNMSIELEPKKAKNYYLRGVFNYDIEYFEGAIEDFSKVIELDSTNIEAYLYRSKTRYKMGEKQEAIKDCNLAILQDSKSYASYELLSSTHCNMGNFKKALKYCFKAFTLGSKKTAKLYKLRSQIYSNLGKTNKALKDINTAIKIEKNRRKLRTLNMVREKMIESIKNGQKMPDIWYFY